MSRDELKVENPIFGAGIVPSPWDVGLGLGLGLSWAGAGVEFADPWDPNSGDSLILTGSRELEPLTGEMLARWWQGILWHVQTLENH